MNYKKLFYKIRHEDLGKGKLIKLLRKETNNYDIELLNALLNDLNEYYSVETRLLELKKIKFSKTIEFTFFNKFKILVEDKIKEIQKQNLKEIIEHKRVDDKIKKTTLMYQHQLKLYKKETTKDEFESLTKEIDVLFIDVFEIDTEMHIENKTTSKTEEKETNPHPNIFNSLESFNYFEKWINVCKDSDDKKISYIFQRLKKDERLLTINHKNLYEWAFKNDYLKEHFYNILKENRGFYSPTKILTQKRNDLYDSITMN